MTSLYDFNGKAVDTRLNYELRPTFGKQAALGFELFDYNARTNSDDLQGGKLYYRRELWPANFGLFDTNDHVTFYLLHDRKFDSSDLWAGQENVKEHIYTRTHESIVGMAGSLARCGPYPDPDYGWKLMPVQEFGGHFLGGEQAFWRSSLELDNYILVWPRYNHKIATRLSGGWGGPADKQLFQLGGAEDLRGYRAKSVDGSRMLMGSVEYRLPLARTLAVPLPFNLVNLDAVQLAAFFDCGKAWDSGFSSQPFRKDAGLGLRFLFDTIGFLEKTVLRVDAARPVNDHSDHEWRFWFELSQPF